MHRRRTYLVSLFARTDDLENAVFGLVSAVGVPGGVPFDGDDQTGLGFLLAVVHVHGARQHGGPVLPGVVDEQDFLAARQHAVFAGRVLDRVGGHVDDVGSRRRALGRVAAGPAAEPCGGG